MITSALPTRHHSTLHSAVMRLVASEGAPPSRRRYYARTSRYLIGRGSLSTRWRSRTPHARSYQNHSYDRQRSPDIPRRRKRPDGGEPAWLKDRAKKSVRTCPSSMPANFIQRDHAKWRSKHSLHGSKLKPEPNHGDETATFLQESKDAEAKIQQSS